MDNAAETNRIRQEGDYWTVEFQGAIFRLRDGKGLQYLAHLLYHPGQNFAALDLVHGVRGSAAAEVDDPAAAERARSAVGKRIRDAVEKIHHHNPALGRYLAVSVRTGRVCGYMPDPMEPLAWSE